jgi:hypothetical protein
MGMLRLMNWRRSVVRLELVEPMLGEGEANVN